MAQVEEPGSRSIGSLTTRIVDTLRSEGSNRTRSPTPSAISGQQRSGQQPRNTIGTRPGALGAAMRRLPAIAEALAARDPLATDRELQASLPPCVAHSLTSVERNWDGPNGFEFQRLFWKLERPVPAEDLETARDLVAITLEPCPPQVLMAELARLRGATARRASSQDDEALAFAVLREELAAYPPDVVRSVLRTHARNKPFFPALSELIGPCEEAIRERRLLHKALNREVIAPPDSDKERLRQESLLQAKMTG